MQLVGMSLCLLLLRQRQRFTPSMLAALNTSHGVNSLNAKLGARHLGL